MNKNLLSTVRFYFAQSTFNSKIHFKAMDRLTKYKNNRDRIMLGCSAVSIFLFVIQVVCMENNFDSVIRLLSALGLGIFGISTSIEIFNKSDFSQLIFQQKLFGEKYKNLRDEFMCLIESIMSDRYSEEILSSKRDELVAKYSAIGELAPETTSEDYNKTQDCLLDDGKRDEEFTWSDKEINRFLPQQLRIT